MLYYVIEQITQSNDDGHSTVAKSIKNYTDKIGRLFYKKIWLIRINFSKEKVILLFVKKGGGFLKSNQFLVCKSEGNVKMIMFIYYHTHWGTRCLLGRSSSVNAPVYYFILGIYSHSRRQRLRFPRLGYSNPAN